MNCSYDLDLNTKTPEQDELEKIIEHGNITPVFQPIVCLKNGEIIGYEALSRGPKDSILQFPDKLFSTAAAYNRLWDLESLCRIKAIEKAYLIDSKQILFINVDPHILKDEKFKKGFTKEFLAKHQMSPESIIFEITEKTAIEDFRSFKNALKNYVDQGYKIAIDDTGSGYSGLKMLAETKPHFVKIDMDLIRNVHIDQFKQALVKTFVDLAQATDMKLIAEGIEIEEELIKLMELGVYAGQGYYLQRPAGTFLDISESAKESIIKFNKQIHNRFSLYSKHYIGQISNAITTFPMEASCMAVKDYLDHSPYIGVSVTKDQIPVGLVMKHALDSSLATQYGVAVFSRRPISLIMNHSPLVVDYYTSINEVSKAAMSRKSENIYDYVIVTKDSKYHGIVAIKDLLEFATMIERNYAMHLNPLTGLPGNKMIETVLNDFCTYPHDSCILYFDLDNFKVYNDTYGFENGDRIIKFTASLIQSTLKSFFPYNSFIGHIGGDDYVCAVESSHERCIEFCKKLTSEFDIQVLDFFNEKDRENGYLEGIDRKGILDCFCLTSLSVAGIYGPLQFFKSGNEVAKFVSDIKKEVKKIKHSSFIIKNLKSS